MPKLTTIINKSCHVACSGGSDSLAALLFAHNHGKRDVTALFINHGTAFSDKSQLFVQEFCGKMDIKLKIKRFSDDVNLEESSKEHIWGMLRHEIYASIDEQVILGHTLDDAVEKFIMKALRCDTNSESLFYEFNEGNLARPFLLWTKEDCKHYLSEQGATWLDDPTNFDGSNLRSWIRMSSFKETCQDRFNTVSMVRKRIEDKLRSVNDYEMTLKYIRKVDQTIKKYQKPVGICI